MEKIQLSERIYYFPASKEPLSSEVVLIFGDENVYIYDVGFGESYLQEIDGIQKEKVVIVSHFHPDHIGNLSKVKYSKLLGSEHTKKYTSTGETVSDCIVIDDGIRIKISLLPASHAKGCLCVEAQDYLFVGDALYPTTKKEKPVYNVQLFKEAMEFIRCSEANQICIGHNDLFKKGKDIILRWMEFVYGKRIQGEAYIMIDKKDLE